MKFIRPILLLSSLFAPLASGAAWAQGGAGVVRSAGYILGPGDVLRISVAGFPEFSQDTLTIPPDGGVDIARLGTIRLSGRTRAAIQDEVRQKLIARVRLRNPQVAVTLLTVRSGVVGNVVMGGDVARGGNFALRENERLSSLLAEAGVSDRLEEKRASLARDGAIIPLDLRAAATRPGSASDVRLRAGDSITVRSVAPAKVVLQGDVARPGVYELHRQPRAEGSELGLTPRLSDLLTRAGGLLAPEGSAASGSPTGAAAGASTSPFAVGSGVVSVTAAVPDTASRRIPTAYSATLQRNDGRTALDVEAALGDVFGPANIVLKSGDVVSIHLVRPITVYLDGAAAKTGSFQLAPDTGVLELLALGGPLSRAPGDLRASIRRGDASIPLDLPALLLSSDSGANVRLQNGDIVQLREPETLSVSVAGQVARPGPVKVRPGATILNALLAAGGVAPGTPVETARLSVLRQESDGSQRVYAANAGGILGLTDVSTNLVLREGDIVNIARGEEQTVFVAGEVTTPGSYPLGMGDTVAQLIARAGGVKEDAALTRVRISRRTTDKTPATEVSLDALDAIKAGKPLPFALKAGDTITVPINTNRVLAVQAFSKPGYYAIPERGQLTLLDLLAQAAPAPGVRQLFIIQASPDGTIDPKKSPTRTVKLDAIQRGKQQNFALQPRDVVLAESPKSKTTALQALGTLGALSFLFP